MQQAQQMCWAESITINRKALSRHEIGPLSKAFFGIRHKVRMNKNDVCPTRRVPPDVHQNLGKVLKIFPIIYACK